MRKAKLVLGWLVIATIALTTGALADTVLTTEATFLNHLSSGYYLEDFTGYTLGVGGALAPQNFSSNGFSYMMSAANGLYALDGAISTDTSTDPMTVLFTGNPVTAVGGEFFVTDALGNNATGVIRVSLNGGDPFVINLTSTQPQVFWSFVSDSPITWMSIDTNESELYWPSLDHFYVGEAHAAPISSTLLLFATGLFGLARLGRRKD